MSQNGITENFKRAAAPQEFFCFFLRMTGIPWILREIYARRKVTIVNYHDPDSVLFAKHLEYFRKHYTIIHIDQLADAFEQAKWHDLPPKSLIITFDDGHAGNEKLFGILSKYKIPAIIYVVAGLVDTNRKFWFHAVQKGSKEILMLKSLDDISRRLKLKNDWGHSDVREYEGRDALTSNELRCFMENGGAIGSHTMFHPLLTKCTEATVRNELTQSRQLLAEMCGGLVKHFAYPGGEWNTQVRCWIQETGYMTARTIDPGWVTSLSDPLALPNFGISDDAGLNKAIVQASGFWDIIKRVVNK